MFDPFSPQRTRPTFTAKEKEALRKQQQGKCNGCGQRLPVRNLTVDHIKPFSKGGTERLTNLQLLCGSCNSMKGDGTQAELKKKLKQKGILKSSTTQTKKTSSTQAKKPPSKSQAKAKSKRNNGSEFFWIERGGLTRCFKWYGTHLPRTSITTIGIASWWTTYIKRIVESRQ